MPDSQGSFSQQLVKYADPVGITIFIGLYGGIPDLLATAVEQAAGPQGISLLIKTFGSFRHDASQGKYHPDIGFVQIQIRVVQSSIPEFLHQVPVSFVRIDGSSGSHSIVRYDALCQSFLYQIAADVQIFLDSHRGGDVERAFPVARTDQINQHQAGAGQVASSFQTDDHGIGDFCAFGNQHP